MRLLQAKGKLRDGEKAEVPEGRPLLIFFLPVALAAVIALAVVVVFSLQQQSEHEAESARVSAHSAAESLAARVSGQVAAHREVLGVVTGFASVQKALETADEDALARSAQAAARLVPDVIQLRLFPQEQVRPDPTGKAPLSFAGVDMVRRALLGEQVPVEIHRIEQRQPYLAVARAVVRDGEVIGVVMGAWPMQGLREVAASIADGGSTLWLMQGGQKGYRIAASGNDNPPAFAAGVPVAGAIWEVFYIPAESGSSGATWVLWGLMLFGALLVLSVIFLQQQSLAGSLRSDLAVLLSLGERVASGENSGLSPAASVAVCRDTIGKMAQLARLPVSARSAGAVSMPAATEVATSAQTNSSDPLVESALVNNDDTGPRPPVVASANIFRAYDVRGIAGQDLTVEVATGLGWAFAGVAASQGVSTVYVAHDARLSGPSLYEGVCSGLAETGMRVVELGMAPAALLYFGMHKHPDAGAILVTGSHNPPEYNGLKLYLRTEPVHGTELQALRLQMERGGSRASAGSRQSHDASQEYLDGVSQEISLTRPLRVVVDGGNGAAGELASETLGLLGCEVIPLFCEPDGNFPNHHPDPSQSENLEALRSEVLAQGADLGIAFDGDGDRIGVVDDKGGTVRPEHILMFLAGDILRRHPGSDVVYDVKSSRQLAGFVLAHGGRPIMWRSGHTRMKEKMRETGALLGGEYAGHIYIKERWYGSDDAIYVAARLLEVFADDPRPLSEQVEDLPSSPSTPEYRLSLEEGESASLMDAIVSNLHFEDARIIDLDGLRVEFPNSWGLVRASNTVPGLTFRFEADSDQELERIMRRFRELLLQVAPDHTAPF